MEWEKKLAVGIQQFDDQHKELIRIISELRSSKNSGESKIYLKSLLFELISYTKYHFTAEERMMEKHNYPLFNDHKIEHEKLTEQVENYLERYSAGKTSLDEEVFEFLKKWLFDHILVTDKNMGDYLHKKGLR
jgi:hemerythrin